MKNLITYLKALWSRVADSQRNDSRHDRRRSDLRRSPSGFNSKLMLKLVSVLVLILTIGSGNVWGATYTITFKTAASDPSGAISTSTAISTIVGDGASCVKSLNTCTKCYGPAISGLKLGSGSATGTFKFTLSDDLAGKTIKSVTIKNVKYGSDSGNITGTATGTNTGALGTVAKGTDLVKDYGSSSTTKITTIQVATSSKRAYISQIIIETIEATPTTTVTASPASITFDRVTLDPEDGAEGSKNVTISLTNGNVGYPGGLSCYLNGWVETDETDCEFFVNSDYTYQHTTSTTSETLSLSYYATDAGTFTGNFIIQGFNASHVAVNCTIPLSVIIDAPACDKTVTIKKGTETNCSFTLSKSGAQASCSGVSTTVTVTPNTGYGTPVVTQSGASATPTITGGGNSWTVTYSANTTGTSVINVSCSAKTTTVSFNQNGGEGGQTTSKTATYGQAMPTPITTPTKTGYTFGGYYDGSGGTGNKYYNADGSSAANWNKDAATATLYAKWTANTYTVSWCVNGSVTSTTPGVAYNTTTSTPANPSVPDECTGSTFMGWTSNSSWASDSAPGDLFNGTSPTITGNITFYAVFADEN